MIVSLLVGSSGKVNTFASGKAIQVLKHRCRSDCKTTSWEGFSLEDFLKTRYVAKGS